MEFKWYLVFFLAGFFSSVTGFELGSQYGMLAGAFSFWLLITVKIWQGGR